MTGTGSPIKLLMVTRERPGDERFGMRKSLLPLMQGLGALGHRAELLSWASLEADAPERLQRARHAVAARIQVPGLAAQPGLRALLLDIAAVGWAATEIALRRGIDRLHAHDVIIAAGIDAALGAAGAATARPSWGLTQHSFRSTTDAIDAQIAPLPSPLRETLHAWERALLDQAQWVLTPTWAGRRQLADDLALDPIPSHWHALPHPRPTLHTQERAVARAQLGWREQDFQVIGVGMYLPVKRFDRLIDACAACGSDLHLTLLGAGDPRPLLERARRHGLGERLTLTASDDIGLYLSAADLYVSTSASESFGMANLEALTAGVPCIVSPVDAVPEVVGDAALLVEPDATTLARAIDRLRADEALRERLRRNAATRIAAWPDGVQTAEQFRRIITALPYQDAAISSCRR